MLGRSGAKSLGMHTLNQAQVAVYPHPLNLCCCRYMDVDSLDFGAYQGGGHGAGPVKARGYPERWLMLFLYALNMATLSALASALPSSQLPAEKLYDVKVCFWLGLLGARL